MRAWQPLPCPFETTRKHSTAKQEPNVSRIFQGEDDGTSLVPVERYLAVRQGEKPLGVYALYDSGRNLQYVGYARNIILAIKVLQLPCLACTLAC